VPDESFENRKQRGDAGVTVLIALARGAEIYKRRPTMRILITATMIAGALALSSLAGASPVQAQVSSDPHVGDAHLYYHHRNQPVDRPYAYERSTYGYNDCRHVTRARNDARGYPEVTVRGYECPSQGIGYYQRPRWGYGYYGSGYGYDRYGYGRSRYGYNRYPYNRW
jgi:hypothetical protein